MCQWGSDVLVRVLVPADLSASGEAYWKLMGIDACLAPLVIALQEGGINMRSSCCGHGKGPAEIVLADGRILRIETPVDPYPATQALGMSFEYGTGGTRTVVRPGPLKDGETA